MKPNHNFFGSALSYAFPCCLFLLLFSFTTFSALAQDDDDDPDKELAPPPVKVVSKDEKKLLDGEPNIKKRTQLTLELMDMKIADSEKASAEKNFTLTLNQLGSFEALMDNALTYLLKNNISNKTDKHLKTLEIHLRKQIPKLETLRRELPYKYGYYVEKLMKSVRAARAKAIEPLFDDTVVPGNESVENKP